MSEVICAFINDTNLPAHETMGGARYPTDFFLRVLALIQEANWIVAGIPKLESD
jgi:hypothetical protein